MHSLEIGIHITKILSASVIYYLGLKNGKITCQTMWEHKRVSNRYVVISGQLNLFCKKQWSNEDFQTQKDLENATKSLEFHSLTDLGQIQRMVLPYKPMTPGQYIMYVYGTALPETLKAPPEQETSLHNLIRIDLKVLTNRVCVCADDEFWRGSKGGESRRKLQAERGFR